MTKARAAIGTAVVLTAACFACSAIVQEIDLACDDDSDCEALNQKEKLGDDACYVYQCRADRNGCEKRPRDRDRDKVPDEATCREAGLPGPLDCQDDADARYPAAPESCDGTDDDCDGVIDEGALDGQFVMERVSELTLHLDPSLAHSTAIDGPLNLALSSASGLELWSEATVAQTIDSRCVSDDSLTRTCSFREVALASNAHAVLAAGVNTTGCARGQVRIGASFAGSPFTWQHSQDSVLRLGVDAKTEPSTAICTSGAGACHLSVSLLGDTDSLHGLVLWRDTSPLPSRAAELRGIAFDLEYDVVPPLAKPRVNAEADTSERLPGALGFDRAALVAWPAPSGGGYFIAYDANDSIELAFLPGPVASSARLAESMLRGEPIKASAPRHVALALDGRSEDAGELPLAVAWRERDGLRVAVISFHPERDPPLQMEHQVDIADAASVREGPVLAFDATGFRTAGTGATGGWYVLWLEQDGPDKRLVGTRISQAEPRAEPKFVIRTEPEPRALFAFSSKSKVAAIGLLAGSEPPDLYIGSLGCR